MGSFNTHTKVNLPCEAQIFGTEGNMTMPFPMWSSFKLVSSHVIDQGLALSEKKATGQC